MTAPETISAHASDVMPSRILVLTQFYPFDPNRDVYGAYQRLASHLQALSALGQVDIGFFVSSRRASLASASLPALRERWPITGTMHLITTGSKWSAIDLASNVHWAARGAVGFSFMRASMATAGRSQVRQVRALLDERQPDLILAHRLGAAAPLLRAGVRHPPIVVDLDDVEHVRLDREAASSRRPLVRTQARAEALLARHAERRIGSMAALLLVASNLDRDKLMQVRPGLRIATLPNSARSYSPLPRAATPAALFVGNMAYPPNRDAIMWFAREVWPSVRNRVPAAELAIVGNGSDDLKLTSEREGIRCVGFAEDLAKHYARARIALCPVRRGGGTRIKILEAAMSGRPVVSTPIGAEGLAFEPDTEILIADDAAGFAESCVSLLADLQRAERMGRASQLRAESVYSATRIAERLRMLSATLIREDQGRESTLAGTILNHLEEQTEIGASMRR